jgi:hypothetical protein
MNLRSIGGKDRIKRGGTDGAKVRKKGDYDLMHIEKSMHSLMGVYTDENENCPGSL